MGSSVNPPAQRARTKATDFSDLFRSAHGSRHSSRTGAGTGSNPSSTSSSKEKPAGTKAMSRRSMIPFLGRKKPGEQTAVSVAPVPRKSVANAAYSVTPVNTVRRSFGNGHAVLMITPSANGLPAEPPSPSKPESSVDVHPSSLGSKLAAHFTPLRSPSRNSKTRSLIQKAPESVPPLPSPTSLSPPALEVRAPSIESQHSSIRSRSTTPRPLGGPHSSVVENGDEEDFSDLFTLPDHLKKSQQYPKSAPATTSAYIYLGDSPKKSGEYTPTTPITPTGPSLQFPIPPSLIIPRSTLAEKNSPRRSSELESLSSQGSRSPAKRPPPVIVDSGSNRTLYSQFSSQDGRRSIRYRATSMSGSDTDTSRANESSYSASSFRFAPVFPKPSSTKSKFSASTAKTSSGPPPSVPLPSPPYFLTSNGLGPRSAPIIPPSRVAFPRPRANTLSVTSNLVAPGHVLSKSTHSSPVRAGRANSHVTPEATVDELQEALTQQHRKNVQLQEYIATITKRHEDDRMVMTKTIEKLERNVRKKMREIEGLRWLVIHNGAVSDIDAAANLARSSLSTQDGDTRFNGAQGPSPLPSSPVAPPYHNGPPFHQSMYGQKGASITAIPEVRSEVSSSATSFSTSSVSDATSLSTPSLSAVSERTDGISRAERQRLKEERRASRALRRISAASTLAPGIDPLNQPSPVDRSLDQNFSPNTSMDDVLEKLQPFRHT